MHVDGERVLDRRVERYVAGAVHHDIEVGRQLGHVGEVTLEHAYPTLQQGGGTAGGVPGGGEDGLGHHLGQPVLPPRVALGAYQHRDMRVRQLGQDAVEQRLADEPGDPGDQHAGSRQAVLEPH